MLTAIHGTDEITLKTFLEREGTDSRHWKIKPVCPECGAEVHPFNVKAAMASIREVSQEVLQRGRHTPGFDHKDDPFDDCPLSHRNDPRFEGLRDLEVDIRTRERNLSRLLEPEIKALNNAVLNELMYALTGQFVSPEQRSNIWNKGKKWLLNITALYEHSWILPYALILLQNKVERRFSGGYGILRFRPIGYQQLDYTQINGEPAVVKLPQAIELCWVNEKNGRYYYKPFLKKRTEEVIFELSLDASQRLSALRGDRRRENGPSLGLG